LNDKDAKSLKRVLLEERSRLEEELAEIVSGNHEKPGMSTHESVYRTHMADAGTDTFERARDLTLEQNVREMLARVTAALERLEAGTYGLCESCGEPIGTERLNALPYADMCIECKRKEEAW